MLKDEFLRTSAEGHSWLPHSALMQPMQNPDIYIFGVSAYEGI